MIENDIKIDKIPNGFNKDLRDTKGNRITSNGMVIDEDDVLVGRLVLDKCDKMTALDYHVLMGTMNKGKHFINPRAKLIIDDFSIELIDNQHKRWTKYTNEFRISEGKDLITKEFSDEIYEWRKERLTKRDKKVKMVRLDTDQGVRIDDDGYFRGSNDEFYSNGTIEFYVDVPTDYFEDLKVGETNDNGMKNSIMADWYNSHTNSWFYGDASGAVSHWKEHKLKSGHLLRSLKSDNSVGHKGVKGYVSGTSSFRDKAALEKFMMDKIRYKEDKLKSVDVVHMKYGIIKDTNCTKMAKMFGIKVSRLVNLIDKNKDNHKKGFMVFTQGTRTHKELLYSLNQLIDADKARDLYNNDIEAYRKEKYGDDYDPKFKGSRFGSVMSQYERGFGDDVSYLDDFKSM